MADGSSFKKIDEQRQALEDRQARHMETEIDGVNETVQELLPEAQRQYEDAVREREAHDQRRPQVGGLKGMLDRAGGAGIAGMLDGASKPGALKNFFEQPGQQPGGIKGMLDQANTGGLKGILNGNHEARMKAWLEKRAALEARERSLKARYEYLQRLSNGRGVKELAAQRVHKRHPELRGELKALRTQEQKLRAQDTLKSLNERRGRERAMEQEKSRER